MVVVLLKLVIWLDVNNKVIEKFQTLINWAGRMTIAPAGKSTIFIDNRIAILVRLCDAPRVGIPINSGAPCPCDPLEVERKCALGIWSRCGRAGGDVGGWWWGGPWN